MTGLAVLPTFLPHRSSLEPMWYGILMPHEQHFRSLPQLISYTISKRVVTILTSVLFIQSVMFVSWLWVKMSLSKTTLRIIMTLLSGKSFLLWGRICWFTQVFCSALYFKETESKFVYYSADETAMALGVQPNHEPCLSCGHRALREQQDEPVFLGNTFSQYGQSYHLYDFIYVLSEPANNGIFRLAQITGFQSFRGHKQGYVNVRWLGRWDDIIMAEWVQSGSAVDSCRPKDDVRDISLYRQLDV